MILSPRINVKELSALARRLAISLSAGVDIRKLWAREAQQAPFRLRAQFRHISDAVAAGDSLSEGLGRTGRCFPRLFREMVNVGEKSGRLPEVLTRLANQYDHLNSMRRNFLASLTWPLFQLSVAILVVGLLIWIMGFIAERNGGKPIDLLGFGLIGSQGVAIYSCIVAAVAAVVVVLIAALRRGWFWGRPLQRAIMKVPGLGRCVETIALAKLAWALNLTLDSTLDLREALPLALRSTNNDYYTRHSDRIVADVVGGYDIHEALARTGAFPAEFISIVEVGQATGMLAESMGRLSHQYEERAQAAMSVLARIAGFGVWCIVAGLIIMLIFRLANFYLGILNDASRL